MLVAGPVGAQEVQRVSGRSVAVYNLAGHVEVVPAYSARAITSGGPITDQTVQRILTEFLAQVQADTTDMGPAPDDIVDFDSHGAEGF